MKSPNSNNINIFNYLQDILSAKKEEIDKWFLNAEKSAPPFFYNSIDLRNSGFKLAPVDTNLFPAGFNNLNEYERSVAFNQVINHLNKNHKNTSKILIIAESHTRNLYYLENLFVLSGILKNAGIEVKLTNLRVVESGEYEEALSHSGQKINFSPITKINGIISTKEGFTPDLILLNDDMTAGEPEILKGVKQAITPPAGLGWHKRRKSAHFEAYENMVHDFCANFDMDPWLISAYFDRCGVVNFKEKTGIECIAKRVDLLITKIAKKYKQYGITEEPYVYVKSDRGTYGMGVMTVKSGDDVFNINKDIRKQMNVIKSGTTNTEVIIQEGVPTIDKVGENPAEPMMYMIGGQAVGCIYRTNNRKDRFGNLNASGMGFASIKDHATSKNVCGVLGLVAKLASYSASWECYVENYSI